MLHKKLRDRRGGKVKDNELTMKIPYIYMTGKIETGQTRIYSPKVETQV